MKRNFVLLIALTAFIVQSCDKEYDNYKKTTKTTIKTATIDSQLIISLNRLFSKSAISIYAVTTKEYGNTPNKIQTEFKLGKDHISICYKEVEFCETCYCAFGPAESRIELGDLQMGTYDLQIKLLKHKIKGKLTVTDSEYLLTLEQNDYASLGNARVSK